MLTRKHLITFSLPQARGKLAHYALKNYTRQELILRLLMLGVAVECSKSDREIAYRLAWELLPHGKHYVTDDLYRVIRHAVSTETQHESE